jgi:hypothetical protein
MSKPRFEDTLPMGSKPAFEDTLPMDEIPTKLKVPPGDFMDTLSDAAVVAPQGVTSWADELMAGLSAAAQVGGGREGSIGEVFDEEIIPIRDRIALARERSPWATTASEVGTGIGSMFVPGAGFGKLAGAGSMMTRGAIEGVGTVEDKSAPWGSATQAGIGAGLGALGSLVSGGVKKITTADPNKIRANVLGARTSEFKEIGIKERENIAKELKDMGLFSNTKVDFDVNSGKFVKKGTSLENLEKPVTGKLLERLNTATKKIQDEKMKVLGKFAQDPVDIVSLENALDATAYKFSKKATGKAERLGDAVKLKETIIDDIMDELEETGATQITIEMIERAKNRLSDDVSSIGKNPLVAKTPYAADLYNSYYSTINKELKKLLGDTKYSNFNDMQQKMITAKTDLIKAVASEDAQKVKAGWGGWMNKLANETLGSPEAGLGTAAAKETIDAILPNKVQQGGRLLIEESPFQGIRFLDPSMELKPPYAPSKEKNSSTMLSPKQMIKYRIPSSTDGILQNKELVLAKIAQANVPDELYETIAYALNESPEQIANVAPLVMTQFPQIFEQSKYKIFDGMIVDPNDKARMADDISKRDDLNSIQRAKMISQINKTGKAPEGIA